MEATIKTESVVKVEAGVKMEVDSSNAPPGSVEKTLENLDRAEGLVIQVLEKTVATAEHVLSLGKGQIVDTALVGGHTEDVLACLTQVHDIVADEIPGLVKYIPFERSSYGPQKDAQIAAKKLEFARDFLRETLSPPL